MPEPVWARLDYDPLEAPNIGTEIIGRGSDSRKSKTYIKDLEMTVLLSLARGHTKMLSEVLLRAHHRHHGVVLSERELRERYPIIASWEQLHQEHVEHFASFEGFSVKAASGMHEDERVRERESSAGTDRSRNGDENGKWR